MKLIYNLFSRIVNTRLKRWIFIGLPLVCFCFILICHFWVRTANRDKIYSNVDDIPARNIALVLGANPLAAGGSTNLFFHYRMQAAAKLYKSGKVKHLIVSGDNHIASYDESSAMKNALIQLGVPDSCITLDYAGFRTLDSVVRCKTAFGQTSIIIVSQEFHNERALFIAERFGLDALAYNAKDVPAKYSVKTRLREYFARVNAVLDVVLLNTKPKFNGPLEPILIH